jgi:hypothetical protein
VVDKSTDPRSWTSEATSRRRSELVVVKKSTDPRSSASGSTSGWRFELVLVEKSTAGDLSAQLPWDEKRQADGSAARG